MRGWNIAIAQFGLDRHACRVFDARHASLTNTHIDARARSSDDLVQRVAKPLHKKTSWECPAHLPSDVAALPEVIERWQRMLV